MVRVAQQCKCAQCHWAVHLLFAHPVVSNSLWPQGLQHIRPPCPSPSPGICSSSCSLLRWCRPAILSSDILFSFCPPFSPALGTFPMSCPFASNDQYTGASASASILPVTTEGWSPPLKTDRFDLLAVQGTFRSLPQHHRTVQLNMVKTLCFILCDFTTIKTNMKEKE